MVAVVWLLNNGEYIASLCDVIMVRSDNMGVLIIVASVGRVW